ncbi:C40 family peptidase [Hymenobacter sp. BT491]|uniref:C40 family peptidase n=1 Tax=Hymenobacter sp. BT491 TaxID=2766779 RepID=UPI001653CF16|nr:C40 family peptidase [Hymenobacter sp. BT491]MBC6990082.1 C40 family peptidase [Hymenobacter sp. BT491]
MRYVWIAFLSFAVVLLALLGRQRLYPAGSTKSAPLVQRIPVEAPARTAVWVDNRPAVRADSVVQYALQHIGTNYCYAGSTPETGFDCSGFVNYVFAHFGVPVPHSTALLINTGRPVPREEARKGDIVVFTGTATTSTTAGHAGIVISEPGQPLRFVHSSSARKESGVKISTVENTDYERRFMGVRRVL